MWFLWFLCGFVTAFVLLYFAAVLFTAGMNHEKKRHADDIDEMEVE